MRVRFHPPIALLAAIAIGCAAMQRVATAAEPLVLPYRWEVEPELEVNWHGPSPDSSLVLDPVRLAAPDVQTRVNEARNILLGPQISDASERAETLRALIDSLRAGDENRQVRLALAAAAVRLSDGAEAEELWALLRDDVATRRALEPVLVRWRSAAALATWRERMADATASNADRIVALEGIAAVGDIGDRSALERPLSDDRSDPPIRLAAARALGSVAREGLEPLATELLASATPHRDLLAAELLHRHAGDATMALLERILGGDDARAQCIALDALARFQPDRGGQHAAAFLEHADNTLRLHAVAALDQLDDADSVRLQATRLADDNPTVRNTVRRNLARRANDAGRRPIVENLLSEHLQSVRFEALEQSALLAVDIHQPSACPRLIELLGHPRPEVHIRAGWALQELAESPEVLAELLAHIQRLTERLERRILVSGTEIIRDAYVIGALGRKRYEPARATLMNYVPKRSQQFHPTTRAAAIWALGKISEGKTPDAELADQLAQRMLDMSIDDMEAEIVQYVSAIALGTIGHPPSRARLLESAERPPYPIGIARQWALDQFDARE